MLARSQRQILETVRDDALVLDVGGWAVPFPRADFVMDMEPYETRGSWGYDGDRSGERFSASTWVHRDICDREPWPFADKQFDFAICSHTLEDVRDPIYVCSELVRVAKAGYIEVPSRLEEQSYVQGKWIGWGHHRWLIDVDQEASHIDFVFKPHLIHGPGDVHFPHGFWNTLTPEERVECFWWEGSFSYRERVFPGAEELEEYLRAVVRERDWQPPDRPRRRWRR